MNYNTDTHNTRITIQAYVLIIMFLMVAALSMTSCSSYADLLSISDYQPTESVCLVVNKGNENNPNYVVVSAHTYNKTEITYYIQHIVTGTIIEVAQNSLCNCN